MSRLVLMIRGERVGRDERLVYPMMSEVSAAIAAKVYIYVDMPYYYTWFLFIILLSAAACNRYAAAHFCCVLVRLRF